MGFSLFHFIKNFCVITQTRCRSFRVCHGVSFHQLDRHQSVEIHLHMTRFHTSGHLRQLKSEVGILQLKFSTPRAWPQIWTRTVADRDKLMFLWQVYTHTIELWALQPNCMYKQNRGGKTIHEVTDVIYTFHFAALRHLNTSKYSIYNIAYKKKVMWHWKQNKLQINFRQTNLRAYFNHYNTLN